MCNHRGHPRARRPDSVREKEQVCFQTHRIWYVQLTPRGNTKAARDMSRRHDGPGRNQHVGLPGRVTHMAASLPSILTVLKCDQVKASRPIGLALLTHKRLKY